MRLTITSTLVVAILAFGIAVTAETTGWRTDGDGLYPGTTPPTSWSATENVVWKADVGEWSNATPVLLPEKNLAIVLSEPDQILGVKLEDGSVAWKDSTADIVAGEVKAHKANGWTTATPVSDGKHVFTVFGSGVVSGHSVDGERKWARLVQQPAHRWGHSASPALGGGRLIVHMVDLFGLDPATGEEAWKVEAEAAWGSPIVVTVGDTEVVVTPAGDVFRADSGERIASEIGKLAYATPVVHDGIMYFIEKRATAVKIPTALDQPWETIWESKVEGSRHYASALVHDGLVYAVSREEKFSILDAATGELVHEKDLGLEGGSNSAYPSLAMAGDNIFLSVESGITLVLNPGRAYDEVARNTIEGFRSSLVFRGDRMYVRAFDGLWCFSSAASAG